MRLRAPFPLPPAHELRIVVALGAAAVAMNVGMLVIGLPLVNAENPLGIVGLELAGNAERAAEIINSWDAVARLAAFVQTGVDFGFVLLYVVALATWATAVAKRLQARWAAVTGSCLSWLMVVAGLADVLANVQMLFMLQDGVSEGRVWSAAVAGTGKFLIVVATLTYAAIGTLRLATAGEARAP